MGINLRIPINLNGVWYNMFPWISPKETEHGLNRNSRKPIVFVNTYKAKRRNKFEIMKSIFIIFCTAYLSWVLRLTIFSRSVTFRNEVTTSELLKITILLSREYSLLNTYEKIPILFLHCRSEYWGRFKISLTRKCPFQNLLRVQEISFQIWSAEIPNEKMWWNTRA